MITVIPSWKAGGEFPFGGEGGAEISVDLRCSLYPLTDLGNAMRFRDRYADRLRYAPAFGWVEWQRGGWHPLEAERGTIPAPVMIAAFDTIASVQREAAALRATGLDATSISEGVDVSKLRVEVGGRKRPLADIPLEPAGLDELVFSSRGCRLASDALARFGRACERPGRLRCIAELARPWLTIPSPAIGNDPLTRFIAACVVVQPGARSRSSKLHELFAAWSRANDGPDWTIAYFGRRMRAKGFVSRPSNGIQWIGLRMVRQVDDFARADRAGLAPDNDTHPPGATDPPADLFTLILPPFRNGRRLEG